MYRRPTKALCTALLLCPTLLSQPQSPTTLGGYGELHYNEPDGTGRGTLDFHRFVLYVAHAFSDRLTFRSELELEHTRIEAGEPEGGEIALEQAFLDFRLADHVGIRAGILLVPVGLINQYHEPPTFHGVERPSLDRVIIPTTWREAGAGVYGDISDDARYQLSIMAGLKADGFSAANALRGGRQEGFESNPANPSFTGRIDYSPFPGLQLGWSFFAGHSSADIDSIGNAPVVLWSADVRYEIEYVSLRAVGAFGSIGDAEKINARFGGNVPDRFYGYAVEGAYNVLPFLAPDCDEELFLFARYEKYNTQAATSGFSPLRQYNRNDILFGLTYRPVVNVACKLDYTFMNNALNAGQAKNTGQFNMGIGYFFN
jgi:hypothetical protein